jgi:hypothetical protein
MRAAMMQPAPIAGALAGNFRLHEADGMINRLHDAVDTPAPAA